MEELTELLLERDIYALDLGSLLAGTKFRGDFEERLKAVINALRKHEGAIYSSARQECIKRQFLFRRLSIVNHQRNAQLLELRQALDILLNQDLHVTIELQSFWILLLRARPKQTTYALHLVTLHGQTYLGGALVAGDELDP